MVGFSGFLVAMFAVIGCYGVFYTNSKYITSTIFVENPAFMGLTVSIEEAAKEGKF